MKKLKPLYIFFHIPKTGGTTINVHMSETMKFDEEYIHLGSWGNDYRAKNDLTPWLERPQIEKNKAKFISGHGVFYGVHKNVEDTKPHYLLVYREPLKRFISGYNFNMSALSQEKQVNIIDYYFQLGKDDSGLGYHKKRNTTNRFIWKMNLCPLTRFILSKKASKVLIRKFNHLVLFYFPKFVSNFYDEIIYRHQYKSTIKLIDKCWFVSTTEHLNEFLPLLFNKLGIKENYNNYRVNDENKNIDNPEKLLDNRVLKRFPITEKEEQFLLKNFPKENKFDYLTYKYILEKYQSQKDKLNKD